MRLVQIRWGPVYFFLHVYADKPKVNVISGAATRSFTAVRETEEER